MSCRHARAAGAWPVTRQLALFVLGVLTAGCDEPASRPPGLADSGPAVEAGASLDVLLEGGKRSELGPIGPVPRPRDRQWTLFNTGSGLPSDDVRALAPAGQGIWIGTAKGVSFLSQGAFKSYGLAEGLPSEVVVSLALGPKGEVWAGTARTTTPAKEAGVARFDGSKWVPIGALPSTSAFTELAAAADGVLWIGTANEGLHRLEGSVLKPFTAASSDLPADDIGGLGLESGGALWVGTGTGGMGRFDGQSWKVYTSTTLPVSIGQVTDFSVGNVVWASSTSGLLRHANGDFTYLNSQWSSTPTESFTSVAVDPGGHVWAATGGAGLVAFDNPKVQPGKAGLATTYDQFRTSNSKLPDKDNSVNVVRVDAAGKVWVGMPSGGLARLD